MRGCGNVEECWETYERMWECSGGCGKVDVGLGEGMGECWKVSEGV